MNRRSPWPLGSFLLFLVATGLGFIPAILLASESGAEPQDLSTPKKAALTFARALEAGDVAAARAASTGTDDDYKILPLISELVGAARSLRDAGVAKFGQAGKTIVSCDAMTSLTQQIETAAETITGDTAHVANPQDPDPMRLHREPDGQWKVDLSAMSDKQSKARVIPRVAQVMRTGAADIKAGKYGSATAANNAIGQQMFDIIAEQAAATRPTTPGRK